MLGTNLHITKLLINTKWIRYLGGYNWVVANPYSLVSITICSAKVIGKLQKNYLNEENFRFYDKTFSNSSRSHFTNIFTTATLYNWPLRNNNNNDPLFLLCISLKKLEISETLLENYHLLEFLLFVFPTANQRRYI